MADPIRNTAKHQSSGRSSITFVLGTVVAILIVYFAIGAYAARRRMKPRRNTDLAATPAAFHLEYQNVWIPSRDAGIQISGWWIPRTGSSKAIVMVHGRGENRTSEFYDHFLDLAAKLNGFGGSGFNVLMIDLRAHGFSGGEYSTWGIGERHDVEGAVDWIKQRGIHPGSIGALGASLGATSCVYATAEDPDISALVADGAGVDDYPTIKQGWKDATGTPQLFFPAGLIMERVLYGYDMRTLRPVEAMKRIPPRPFLLIYGLKELPPDSDRRRLLTEALPNANLWVVPGAAHTGAYTAEPQAYLEKVGAFFENNLK
jgi:pimeloyl-ACP methyl ester carboxylesterase